MNDLQIQEAFLQFLAQKSGAKNEKELKAYVESLGKEGLQQAYAEFTQLMQQQALKAQHGAKLNYFRRLKNQCGPDEEVVYFKKGGQMRCGCAKKANQGRKIEEKCGGGFMKPKIVVSAKGSSIKK